ncbi:hypothetical protein LTR53_013142 [Teratosphaeriaceae sp. CCFEE 6253]|nr:hypothetical protein LTR53_013142 [Teratosphaeriaceae sp. CCFEE 6253]
MAGNPFRRQQRLPDETTYDEGLVATRAIAQTTTAKPKKKKKVVIQTPPHSPEEPRYAQRFSGSPSPPPAAQQRVGEDVYPATSEGSGLGQAALNTRTNPGSLPPPTSTDFGAQTSSRAPYNPFARTLATSEAAFGLQAGQDKQVDSEIGAGGRAQGGAARPMMDVDAFTSILMGGAAAPPIPSHTPAASTPQLRPPESNSSGTDTSSLSRHSIFDSMQDLAHPESPRTSFDDNPDDSDDENGDDEHSSLMGPVAGRPIEEGPPAPPKHKHGRAFPQTVSFADFDENIPSAGSHLPLRLQTPVPEMVNGLRPSTPRSPSDLNKPLPPPPASVGDAVSLELPQKLAPASYQPSMSQTDGQSAAKKAAPPPPVTRRRGQGSETGATGRPRSESNLSQSSAQQHTELNPASSADQNAKPAPPPPPSRRPHPAVTNSPPTAVDVPPSPSSTTREAKPVPLPPPRRHPSTRGTGTGTSTPVTRTPSTTSRASLPRSDSFTASNAHASTSAPPAPPPRRGGGSGGKRESVDAAASAAFMERVSDVDYRRTSGQSFHSRSERSASLQRVEEPDDEVGPGSLVSSAAVTARPPEGDVLADLDAFRAEIEALRLRAAGGAAG